MKSGWTLQRRAALLTAWMVMSACSGCEGSGTPRQPPEPPKPKTPVPSLFVIVVVDQLMGEELVSMRPLFRYGLKRLVTEGRHYTRAMHTHGRTETASGHATIATGVLPRHHGVIDKALFDRATGETTYVCNTGILPCAADIFEVPTFAQRVKKKWPEARVLAFAQKDRSAGLLAGPGADVVAWLNPREPGLIGRSGDKAELPSWLTTYFEQVAAPERVAWIWELPRVPEPFSTRPDEREGERDPGHGTSFPHRVPGKSLTDDAYRAWFQTPDSDRVVMDLALRSLRRLELGTREVPDVLLLSLGAVDSIGHSFGPGSLERVGAITELDRLLGDLLGGIEGVLGEEHRALVLLSSDHGVDELLPTLRERGVEAARVDLQLWTDAITSALSEAHPEARVTLLFPQIYIDGVPPTERDAAVAKALTVMRQYPELHAAWPTKELENNPDPIAALLLGSTHPARGGDIVFSLKPHHIPLIRSIGDLGSNHGTPWDYDRHVPVVLWGAEVEAATIDEPVAVIDAMRTIADRAHFDVQPNAGAPLP